MTGINLNGVQITKTVQNNYMDLNLKYFLTSQNIAADLKGPTALCTIYGTF